MIVITMIMMILILSYNNTNNNDNNKAGRLEGWKAEGQIYTWRHAIARTNLMPTRCVHVRVHAISSMIYR